MGWRERGRESGRGQDEEEKKGEGQEEGESTIYSCTCVESTCLHYTVNVVIILHQVTCTLVKVGSHDSLDLHRTTSAPNSYK